jgi:acyl carrier protein
MERWPICFGGSNTMDIKEILHQYIHANFLKGEQAHHLQYDTPLLSSGIIDSIGVLGLINFIERMFSIEFKPKELDRDRLETIERMDEAIKRKLDDRHIAL